VYSDKHHPTYPAEQEVRKTKILQVISYGYVAGGAERLVLELTDQLKAKGHQVLLVSSDHIANQAGHFSDIQFHEIDAPGRSILYKVLAHLWYPTSYRCVHRTVARFKPDIIHFHTMQALSPSAIFAIKDVPAVLTVHGPEEFTSLQEWALPSRLFRGNQRSTDNLTAIGRLYMLYYRSIQRTIYKMAFRSRVRVIVTVSRYFAEVLANDGLGPRVEHIYNGLILPEPSPIVNLNRLLYVGRLEQVKGVAFLLRALAKVVQVAPSVRLEIVGDGPQRRDLEALAREQGLGEYVTFHGWLGRESVLDQYREATILIIPSIGPEAAALVCVEALAVGRPVIVTNVGGMPEFIEPNKTGIIVPPGRPDDIASAVIDLLGREDLSDIAQACSDSAQKYSMGVFLDRIEELYREVIASA
jgi:glycosyltransferase involved in cell wall biosynthesis